MLLEKPWYNLKNMGLAIKSNTKFCIVTTKNGVVLFHDAQSNDGWFMHKLSFFACHEQLMQEVVMLGSNKKVTHTETNLQLKDTGLFTYVWPFCYHQALKGQKLHWIFRIRVTQFLSINSHLASPVEPFLFCL